MAKVTDEEAMALVERLRAATGPNNGLDVLVEVALFEPDSEFISARPNAAGTKVIFTRHDGSEATFWAEDYTFTRGQRKEAIDLLAERRKP